MRDALNPHASRIPHLVASLLQPCQRMAALFADPCPRPSYLPRRAGARRLHDPAAPEGSFHMPEQAQGRLPLVVIADAHEWSARSWASLLGPRGYEVVQAHSGAELLASVTARQPDAIVVQ